MMQDEAKEVVSTHQVASSFRSTAGRGLYGSALSCVSSRVDQILALTDENGMPFSTSESYSSKDSYSSDSEDSVHLDVEVPSEDDDIKLFVRLPSAAKNVPLAGPVEAEKQLNKGHSRRATYTLATMGGCLLAGGVCLYILLHEDEML